MSVKNLAVRRLSVGSLLPIAGFRDPLSLTDCAAWWDFSDASRLATATNGTGAVSNGSQIAYCADRSGNGRHITQATANNRPTWSSTGLNSLGAASFNGTTTALSTAAAMLAGDTSFTFGFVFTRAATATGFLASVGTNNSALMVRDAYSSAAGSNLGSGTGNNYPFLSNSQVTGTGVVGMAYSTGNGAYRNHAQQFRNGTTVMTSTNGVGPSTVPTSTLVVGYTPFVYHSGLIAEMVVYSRVLSAAELTSLSRYLGAKWGITVA